MIAPILAVVLAAQTAPPASPPPTSDASPEAEIAAVLDTLHASAARADGAVYFNLFTSDARYVGTDASEHWTVARFRAYAEPYFSRGRGWTYGVDARTITVADIACRCVAWFEERLHNAGYGETRGSGVLRLTDGGWKIEQYVLSFAVPNETAGPVVRVIAAYRAAAPAAAEQAAEGEADAAIDELDAGFDRAANASERQAEAAAATAPR